MPGHMGAAQRTVKNVWVYKIDPARNLIWVRGQVSISIWCFRLALGRLGRSNIGEFLCCCCRFLVQKETLCS